MVSLKITSLLAGVVGAVAVVSGAILGNSKTRKKVEEAVSDLKDKVGDKTEEKK